MKHIILKSITKPAVAAILAVLALTTVTTADPGRAATQICISHDKVVKKLGSRVKEKRQAFGLINSSRMLEIFVSKQGSWTIVVTTPDKMSCIVAAGNSWEQWKATFGPAA